MHPLYQIIYYCKTLYMLRTVFPSIMRSSKLRIQQWYISNSCCYLLLSGMRWNAVVFPSIIRSSKLFIQQRYMPNSCCYLLLSGMRWDGHHQELKTAYTATVYVKQLLLPAAIGDEMGRPSSGAQNRVYSNGICQIAAATCCYRG